MSWHGDAIYPLDRLKHITCYSKRKSKSTWRTTKMYTLSSVRHLVGAGCASVVSVYNTYLNRPIHMNDILDEAFSICRLFFKRTLKRWLDQLYCVLFDRHYNARYVCMRCCRQALAESHQLPVKHWHQTHTCTRAGGMPWLAGMSERMPVVWMR